MTTTPTPAVPAERAGFTPGMMKLALTLILGLAAPLLDSTIVNVAIHTLGVELHTSVATIQWVSTGYLLAMAVAVPITGWAGERFGTRRVWLSALALFLVGSMLSGLAWSVESLIIFRVLQGLGTGLLMPMMMTIMVRSTGGRPSGAMMALISIPTLLGPVLGPVLGGVILDQLSWRWIFFVNPPICLLAIVLAWRLLPAGTSGRGDRLDVPGLLLVTPALAAIVYGLSQVGTAGGFVHPRVLVPVLGGAVLLAGFVGWALRAAEPLIDLRLFRVRSFSACATLMFLSGLTSFGPMLLLPLYYQQLRGQSVIDAGLLLAPQGLGIAVSRFGNPLLDRFGVRPVIVAGVALLALGTLPFVWADQHTGLLLLSGALVVRGAGLGVVLLGVMLGAYTDLSGVQVPHASSLTRIMQQVGGSFGTATLAVILQHQLTAAHGPAAQAAAFQHTFGWAVAFGALALVPALLLPGRRPAAASAPVS